MCVQGGGWLWSFLCSHIWKGVIPRSVVKTGTANGPNTLAHYFPTWGEKHLSGTCTCHSALCPPSMCHPISSTWDKYQVLPVQNNALSAQSANLFPQNKQKFPRDSKDRPKTRCVQSEKPSVSSACPWSEWKKNKQTKRKLTERKKFTELKCLSVCRCGWYVI